MSSNFRLLFPPGVDCVGITPATFKDTIEQIAGGERGGGYETTTASSPLTIERKKNIPLSALFHKRHLRTIRSIHSPSSPLGILEYPLAAM